MKKYLIIAFLLLGVIAYAQTSKMPEKVKTAFNQKYSTAVGVDWSDLGTEIEVQFEHNSITKMATYSKMGEWIQTTSYIEESDIPDVIVNQVVKSDPNAYISYVEKVEMANGTNYIKLVIETDNASFVNQYDLQGKLLSSKKEVYEDYEE